MKKTTLAALLTFCLSAACFSAEEPTYVQPQTQISILSNYEIRLTNKIVNLTKDSNERILESLKWTSDEARDHAFTLADKYTQKLQGKVNLGEKLQTYERELTEKLGNSQSNFPFGLLPINKGMDIGIGHSLYRQILEIILPLKLDIYSKKISSTRESIQKLMDESNRKSSNH